MRELRTNESRAESWVKLVIAIASAVIMVGVAYGSIRTAMARNSEDICANTISIQEHAARLSHLELSSESRLARIEEKLDWLQKAMELMMQSMESGGGQ